MTTQCRAIKAIRLNSNARHASVAAVTATAVNAVNVVRLEKARKALAVRKTALGTLFLLKIQYQMRRQTNKNRRKQLLNL